MNRRRTIGWRKTGVSLLLLAVIGAVGLSVLLRHRRNFSLPYRDSFSSGSAAEWQAFGGVWELANGTVFDRSDERGAKLVTGSRGWDNYRLQADLEMIGNQGDVGVILRAGQIEQGIDSYNGYYVGLRSLDSSLVMGRADHGWLEGRPVPMPGGVRALTWYRLTVVAIGCRVAAAATNLQTGQTAWGALEESGCVRSGKVGLRSMSTGAAWKDISVTRASPEDLSAMAAHAGSVEHPDFPTREADYNRMRAPVFMRATGPARIFPQFGAPLREENAEDDKADPEPVSIESLRTVTSVAAQQRIRGVVTLTHPLYIQDSSGGIAVDVNGQVLLNLGDEIEVTGTLTNSGYSARFEASNIRLLWDRTLAVPLSISSTQAASGAFNGSLVEVRGYLRSKRKEADGSITLNIGDESQSFSARLRNNLSDQAYESWQPGSWLRIKGICVAGEPFTAANAAFVVLARSSSDIEVIAGPPWWSGSKILRVIIPAFLLLLLAIFIYVRVEHWKMRGIMDERERLAHEMHDTLAQSFAGVGFHLQGMRNSIRTSASLKAADFMDKLDVACELVAQTHREASASIAALHPDADEGRDLLVALDHYTKRMLNATNLPLILTRDGVRRELSLPVRDALFQVGREAITNVIRHSHADQIGISLKYEPRSVLLEVSDNGVGFNVDRCRGFGIKTMQSRCEAVGAQFSVQSADGCGTVVSVRSPYGKQPNFTEWVRQIWKRHTAQSSSTADASAD